MAPPTFMSAVRSLKEMFPELPDRVIKAAVFSSDNDINAAADWLLFEGVATAPSPPPPVPWPLLPSPSPPPEEAPPKHALPSPSIVPAQTPELQRGASPSSTVLPPVEPASPAEPAVVAAGPSSPLIPLEAEEKADSFLLHQAPVPMDPLPVAAHQSMEIAVSSAETLPPAAPAAEIPAAMSAANEESPGDADDVDVPTFTGVEGTSAALPELKEAAKEGNIAEEVSVSRPAPGVVVSPPCSPKAGVSQVDTSAAEELVPAVADAVKERIDSSIGADNPDDGGSSPDWVVTTLQDAAAAAATKKDAAANADGDDDGGDDDSDSEDGLLVDAHDSLEASVGSLSVLGAKTEADFDKDAFDTALASSSTLKDSLQLEIEGVEALRLKVLNTEAKAKQAERMLQQEREQDDEDQELGAFMLQKARGDVDQMSSELASEKGILAFEARQLRSRLEEQGTVKVKLQEELQVMRTGLLARLAELEARIKAVEEETKALEEAKGKRVANRDAEMAKIAEQQRVLDEEKRDCAELKSFLDKRKEAVDNIAGGISHCADEIEKLRRKIERDAAIAESACLQSSFVSMASSAASLPVTGSVDKVVDSLMHSRISMKEVLGDLLSSSEEGSMAASSLAASSSSNSDALFAEALGSSPRRAALQMLSFVSGSGSELFGRQHGVMGAESELVLPDVPVNVPVVRVSEVDAEMADARFVNTEQKNGMEMAGVSGGQPGSPMEKEDGWESVAYPEIDRL